MRGGGGGAPTPFHPEARKEFCCRGLGDAAAAAASWAAPRRLLAAATAGRAAATCRRRASCSSCDHCTALQSMEEDSDTGGSRLGSGAERMALRIPAAPPVA